MGSSISECYRRRETEKHDSVVKDQRRIRVRRIRQGTAKGKFDTTQQGRLGGRTTVFERNSPKEDCGISHKLKEDVLRVVKNCRRRGDDKTSWQGESYEKGVADKRLRDGIAHSARCTPYPRLIWGPTINVNERARRKYYRRKKLEVNGKGKSSFTGAVQMEQLKAFPPSGGPPWVLNGLLFSNSCMVFKKGEIKG